MRVQVRPFRPQDAQKVSALIVQNLREVVIQEYSIEAVELLVAQFSPEKLIQESGSQITLVAVQDQNLVGTASLQHDRVRSVFVGVARHGTGIGRTLMAALEEEAQRQDIPKLYLMSGLSACGFYKRLGYGVVEHIDRVVDGVPLPVIHMEKALISVDSDRA